MPSSKEIPDKGLLTSANSGMTELVLFFFAVIPRLMRDLPFQECGVNHPAYFSYAMP
jgi:hypothetical protein